MIATKVQLLSLKEAANLLPVKVHEATLYKWCRVGVAGVRLESRRIGGKIRVTEDAVNRFLASLDVQQESTA